MSHLLTRVDRFTRWSEAFPIPNTEGDTAASAFFSSDGSQGANQTRTTSYHPKSNGAVERFHRQLKSALMNYKDNAVSSSAELIYVTALKLPGEFFFSLLPIARAPEFLQSLRRQCSCFEASSCISSFFLSDIHHQGYFLFTLRFPKP
ncbi:transposon Ty3-I Gag-Pol polyprotein [Nephila pilipes]|uniref:Transposon Ty3-I Gag-Pol polyprotein n=1 Tax=Nephila pilipes TaxID=299642 RepID=A0A8X6NX16_NEPPI|nr:transposon Ty3-I Gag-Pol polyprotein [Nephila pilipes]